LVYGLLHRRRDNPPTTAEIRFFLQAAAAADITAEQALRGLRDYFDITADADARQEVRHHLRGWAGARSSSEV
jgi:hypothetical protein